MNPFEFAVVKLVDELGFVFYENVWLTDLPKMLSDILRLRDETPFITFEVSFDLEPVKNSDDQIEYWSGFCE